MTAQTNILLTGATGFVGQALLTQLLERGEYKINAALRNTSSFDYCAAKIVGDFTNNTNWSDALSDQQVVIHTAGRAHIMKDEVADSLAEFRRVNVDSTLNLARQAAASGVKRFIFLSSIKVNGEQTSICKPFTADDSPAPKDYYGISKLEAERGLQQIVNETGMEVVIIRPPLVYGPGVKGNFASLIKLVIKGLPLPLGGIYNQRSLVALDNLVDLIITCIDHPAAANQVFLAGDGQDLSTTELLRGVARAAGVPSRLVPIPNSLLILVAFFLGKIDLAQRLLGSLQVDIKKARDLLGWTPPLTVDEGLSRCFKDSN